MEGSLFVAMATVAAMVITGIFTLWQVRKQHRESLRRMREESIVLKQRTCNDKRLEALQHCWGILIYTTDNENNRSIITYKIEKEKDRDRRVKRYYFHKSNIEAFIDSLCCFFYKEGWGLYLSKELKELLFVYERTIWKLKLAGEKSEDEVQPIMNFRFAEELFELHQKLIIAIKQDMKKICNF